MTREEFVKEFAEILGISPDRLHPDTELATFETWDSVAYLSTMILFDERVGFAISPEVVAKAVTLTDLMKVAGDRLTN